MHKQRTKQQIIEAIKHWESVLRMLDESKSSLIDDFIEKFGEDIVLSRNGQEVKLTESMFS